MPPGGTWNLHLLSRGFTPLLRNRSVPSRRASLHLGPVYLAIFDVSCLDATLLGRAAAVVRNRRDIGNAGDLEAAGVQGTHRRLATGARATDAHFDVLHAVLLRSHTSLLGRHLRRERGGLARTAEAATARGRPGKRVPLAIGDRDDGVVERRVHVRDAVQHVLACLLRLLGTARGGRARCTSRCRGFGFLLVSHVSLPSYLNFARRSVQLHGLLARALARARVRARALAADRQTLAMTDAAVRAEVHE